MDNLQNLHEALAARTNHLREQHETLEARFNHLREQIDALNFEALAGHVIECDDPWQGLTDVLAILREKNACQGGDDRQLALLVGMYLALLGRSIPMPEVTTR